MALSRTITMILPLLLSVGLSATPISNRKERIFNIFNIVKFPNDQCTARSSRIGTCYTSGECSALQGTIDGPCASAFGVCCIFTNNFCGSTISHNRSYLWSTRFPSDFVIDDQVISTYIANSGIPASAIGNGVKEFMDGNDEFVSRCQFNINRCSQDVCAPCTLRFDFETFDLLAGLGTEDVDSECRDTFQITNLSNGNFRVPTLCGYNSGEHIYVDIGNGVDQTNDLAATVDVRFGIFTGSRRFNILVSQFNCDDPNKPPDGCTQYFTGKTGQLTTYNFHNPKKSAHLDKQDYQMCIRRELGYCCVEYNVCDDASSFSIDNSRYELFAMTTDNRQIADLPDSAEFAETTNLASSTCTRDWIEIDASNEVCSETGIFYNKFCGFTFGTGFTSDNDQNLVVSSDISDILKRPHRKMCDCTPPFNVGIRTSNETRGGTPVTKIRGQPWDQEEASVHARGICLNYEQILCN